MNKHQAVCVLVAILSLFTPPLAAQGVQEQPELVVYAYDSFSGDWGGPALSWLSNSKKRPVSR